jgi:hypothetical protein
MSVKKFADWETERQKSVTSAADLVEYVGYAAPALVAEGHNPDEVYGELYQSMYKLGRKRGLFTGKDQAAAQQEFESFTQLPLADPTKDFELLANDFEGQERIEDATRLRSLAESLRAGSADQAELDEVKTTLATASNIQAARINYARDNNLSFIDYPTSDDKRRVWVNPDEKVVKDRATFYGDAQRNAGLVDPRYADVAEQLNRPGKNGMTGWQAERMGELARLAEQRFGSTVDLEEMQEAAQTAVERKKIGDAYIPYASPGALKKTVKPEEAAEVGGVVKNKYVSTEKLAGSLYDKLPTKDPIKEEYTREEFTKAMADTVLQRLETDADFEAPENNFVTLPGSGATVPLPSATMLPKDIFDKGARAAGLDERELNFAKSLRTQAIAGNYKQINNALHEFDERYADWVVDNADKFDNQAKMVESYIDQMDPETSGSTWLKTKGVLRSIPDAGSTILQGVGMGLTGLVGWDSAYNMFEDRMIADVQRERDRNMVLGYMGDQPGLVYEGLRTLVPVVADIVIARGAGLAAKATLGAAARTTTKLAPEALRNANTFIRDWGIRQIDNVLSGETKGLVGNFLKGRVGKYTAAGAEANPKKIFRAMRRDIIADAPRTAAYAGATASQYGTAFTRSAHSSYANSFINARNETNEDGSRKYTDDEARQMAVSDGMISGLITVATMGAMHRFLGPGAEVTTFERYNIGQLRRYTSQVASAFRRTGLGGDELYNTVRAISDDVLKSAYKNIPKQAFAEGAEEFVDEFTQSVVLDMYNNRELKLGEALENGLKAFVLGGFIGSAVTAVSSGAVPLNPLKAFRKDLTAEVEQDFRTGTAQQLQLDVLGQTIKQLEETGNSPQTLAVLKDLTRRAQRSFRPVDELITPRDVRDSVVQALNGVEEQDTPARIVTPVAPTAARTPNAVPTQLARKLADRLGIDMAELLTIAPSGEKNGRPQITPNDVRNHYQRKVESTPPPAPEVQQEPVVPAYERTFRELEGRVVVLNNERGRVRISEESGVLLDREDGNPPLEITPNPDMVSGEFEGFNSVVDEPARVSPRRAPRRFVGQAGQETEVATVLDNGVMRYGNTDYSLPTEPLFANVRLDDAGDVESMHVRVFAPNGDASWVFVADESAARLVQAYGNSNINISNAIETAVRTDISRNEAANRNRQKQRTQRRKQRQQQFSGPPLTSRTQRVVDENRDFRLENFVSGKVPAELNSELRNAATTLGIDPDVVTDSAELLQLIGGEVAAGLDMSDLATDQDIAEVLQRAQAGQLTAPSTPLELAVTRVLDGQLPTNLLEFMLDSHLTSLSPGKVTAVAKLRAKHAEQIKRHSLNNETDLRDIIGSVARSAKSQLHRATAKLLLETGIPNTRVFFVYLPNNLETAAAYLPNSNAIIVNLMADNGGGPVDALLHELAGHAKLDEAVVNPANENMARVRDELFRLREELWTRAQQVHGNRMPADLRYALEGRVNEAEPFDEIRAVREMLAHFKASEKFHKQLAGLDQTGERSFVQKFIDLIARLFGGANPSPTIRKIAESLGNLEQAIREANATAPYGRTVGQISASRAANLQGQKVGPLFGQTNPNERTDFAWVDHQIKSLRYQPISTADIQDIIQNQAFGMMTGENPNNTVATEEENVGHNARAEEWLRSRGYDFVRIVGRYDAKGENSFLVPGLTTQDAIDFAVDFEQESTATDTGLVYQDGSYRPRTGEDLQKPVSQDDDYFSATLDENGNVVPIRVDYDFDILVQPTPEAPPLTTAEGQQFGALQSEYPTFETTDYSRAVVFDGVNVHVNPQAAAEAYGQLDPDAALAAQQFDLAVAFAAQGAEAEAGSVAQDLGFTPEQLVEAMAQDQLGSEQIQDLVANPNGLGFVLRTFHELSNRNPGGNNARISEAVNRVAELGRQITAKGVAPVTATAVDPNDPMANAGQVADQFVNPQPIISMSRVVYAVDPAEVKGRTKPGRTVGTRKPTGKKRTEEGVDPNNRIELSVIRERNPVLYRRMALILLELPLVARDYPELAKFVADERAKHQKNIKESEANGSNLKRLNVSLKTMVAQDLGRRYDKGKNKGQFNPSKVTATEFDDYIQADGENFAKDAQGVVRRKGLQARFRAGLQRRERMMAKSDELSDLTTKSSRAYSNLLSEIAENSDKTSNKRIAELLEQQADDIIETLVAQTSENLKTLFDLVPEDLREIAKLWYDGANIIAQGMDTQHGIGLERASAVLAVFSPQKDWFQNVAMGQRTVEIWTNDQDYAWDEAMSAQWLLRGGEPQPELNENGSYKWPKGVKPRLDDEADDGLARDENGSIIFEQLSSAKKAELLEQAKQRLEEMRGKTLRELNPQQQAWFVRMREETKYPNRQYPAVRPDGVFLNAAKNPKTGIPIKLAWGGYGAITKSLNILKAADADLMAVVDEELGGAHKVRSFYNNIVDPQNAEGHVTTDTHAIAALLWRALSGTSREVSQNFGSGGNSSKDSNLGVAGLYPVFAEPYRRLAKALTDAGNPYLPREVQSVTWEVIRLIFSPESKRDAKKLKTIEETWRAYAAEEIDANTARSQIFSTALGRDLTMALDNPSDAENVGIGTFAWQDVVRRPVDTSTVMQSRSVLTAPAESSMEVRAHVDAKFGSLASKLRVNVVPNFTGVDARYVVEGRQGRAYVEYNPMAFVGEPVAVLEAAMREEFIHAASHAALRAAGVEWVEFYTELAQSLSAEQRKTIKSVYRSARNDVDYGAEFLRMGVQKMLYGTVTEAEMRSRSYAKIQQLMADVVGWFDSQKVNDITRQVYNDTVRMVRGADTGISRSRALDAEYLSLAQNPEANRERLQELVDQAARAAGYTTKPWYHGSPTKNITVFNRLFNRDNYDKKASEPVGIWFTEAEEAAKILYGDNVTTAYLKLKNPIVFNNKSSLDEAVRKAGGYEKFRKANPDNDGVELPTVRVVFEPNQIKSADPVTRDDQGNVIPLSQRFQTTSPDIRRSRQTINWDVNGIGSVPNQVDIDYFGFVVPMLPSEFRKLVPVGVSSEETKDFIKDKIQVGEAIAPPFIGAEWNEDKKVWVVYPEEHEGRSRTDAAQEVAPNEIIPVSIFPKKGMRARGITEEMRNAPFVLINDQDKIVFTPRRTQETSPDIRRSRGLYLKSQEVVAQKIQGRSASLEQIRALLSPAYGIKAEELKWTGVMQEAERLAKENNGKVPKDALLQYLNDDGAVRLEEVTLSKPRKVSEMSVSEWAKETMPEQYAQWESATDPEDKAFFAQLLQKEYDWRAYANAYSKGKGDPKFAQYTLPGGDNYREVVLTMPAKPLTELPSDYKIQRSEDGLWYYPIQVRFNSRLRDAEGNFIELSKTEEEAKQKALDVLNSRKGDFRGRYTSTHFLNIPNYVAHMRVNERTLTDGSQGLFVEEFQSDRHQAGRKKGYKEDTSPEDIEVAKKVKEDAEEKLQLREYAIREENGFPLSLKEIIASGRKVEYDSIRDADAVRTELKAAVEQARQRYATLTSDGQVADAPFRTTWPIQLFKRALRDAVDGGKDWIGWTTGETQAERFDLSKQVDRVVIGKNDKGYWMAAWKNPPAEDDVEPDIERDGLSESQLADHVGKDLAKKALEDIGGKNGQRGYRGLDLKVGGEGMKGFYDTMLPNEIGKYVKQWSGKVEKTQLPNGKEIWAVRISPEMRTSVQKLGQPMFSRAQYGPNFDNWFGDSKVVDGDGQPLRVFRGADRDFGADWTGRWFAVDPAIASEFAAGRPDDSGATPFVGAYYLSLQNPLVVDAAGARWNRIPTPPEVGIGAFWDLETKKQLTSTDEIEMWLQTQDEYDGVLFRNIVEVDGTKPTDVYLVRNQTQIKSATGNRGTYDPADLDVTRSRATYGTTPSIEGAFAAGVGDLFVNQDGDWDSGAWWAGSFRPGGRVDPRVFEIRNYQQQAMELAQMRMKQFSRNLNDAMKAEGNAVDPADLNLALGTTEPTVSDAARRAADDARAAAYAAADEAYTAAPAMKRYRELLNDAKTQYGVDGDKAAYTRNVEQARQVLENSREKRMRAVAYAAADQAHATAIRDARAASLVPLRAAMRGAMARLQANAPAVAEAVADLRGAVDELSAQLRDELAIDDPVRAVIDQNLGVYLVRRYRLHHEEGYAARLMSDPELAGLRDKGREFFEKSWIKDTYELWREDVKYAVYSDAEVMSLVRAEAAALDIGTKKLAEYVSQHGKQPNPTAAAAERTNLTRFMQKQEVPAELREVMGEYVNPVTNALNTYAELARFLGTQRALNQYTDIGVKSGWLVTADQIAAEPDKYFSYEPLTKTTKTRGGNPLSNFYAEPEIVEAFESMFNPSPASQQTAIQRAQRAAAWVTGMSMASMTLLSLGFYVRNVVGNGFFMWMNGYVPNLDDLKQSYYGVKEVYGGDLDQFGAKLVALGIAKTNLRENLLRDVLRGVVDNPEDAALRLLSATDELASPRGWLAKSENFLSAPAKKLAEVAAAIDLQYRVAYWAHEIRVLENAYRNDPNPPTREQIEQMAARVVNRTSQGSQRNPPIVKEFTRSGLGTIFNSFFRFTSEMVRMPVEIIGRGLEETRSGNAVLRNRGLKRLAGIGTMTAMVGYGIPELLKLMFEIDDEEEEAARRGLPEYARDASLLFTRDDDGTINSWDLTFVNPLSMWTDPVARAMNHIAAGRYEQAVLATMRGFGSTLLSPQILTDAMISLYNGVNEYGQPIWLQDDHLGEKAMKMAKHIGSTALGARTPKKIWQAVSSYLDGGIYDEEAQVATPLKIIATEFMPVRQRTYDPARLAGRAFGELRIRNTDLKADTTKQLRSGENLSRADVFQILDDHERKNRKIARDLRSISRGFLKLGVSERDLKKVATDKGISERRFNLAYKRGQYERYVPPEALFADIERNLGESGQAKPRIRYIREWLEQRGRLNPVD